MCSHLKQHTFWLIFVIKHAEQTTLCSRFFGEMISLNVPNGAHTNSGTLFGQIKLNLISLNGVNDLIVDFLMSSSMGRDWIPVHQDRDCVVRFYNKIYRKKLWKLCNANNNLSILLTLPAAHFLVRFYPKINRKK